MSEPMNLTQIKAYLEAAKKAEVFSDADAMDWCCNYSEPLIESVESLLTQAVELRAQNADLHIKYGNAIQEYDEALASGFVTLRLEKTEATP